MQFESILIDIHLPYKLMKTVTGGDKQWNITYICSYWCSTFQSTPLRVAYETHQCDPSWSWSDSPQIYTFFFCTIYIQIVYCNKHIRWGKRPGWLDWRNYSIIVLYFMVWVRVVSRLVTHTGYGLDVGQGNLGLFEKKMINTWRINSRTSCANLYSYSVVQFFN
jgi:hypothetical protein